MPLSKRFTCLKCNKSLASLSGLSRHKENCLEVKPIYDKKSCNRSKEILEFNSDEFGPGGIPKTAETMRKLNNMVNSQQRYNNQVSYNVKKVLGNTLPSLKWVDNPVQQSTPIPKNLNFITKPTLSTTKNEDNILSSGEDDNDEKIESDIACVDVSKCLIPVNDNNGIFDIQL